MLNKINDLPSGIVHMIYALIALPTLFYLANKVTIIAEDAAARREALRAQEVRIKELERQVDFLMKRLINKTVYRLIFNQETGIPEIWLQTMPIITRVERRRVRM